MNLTTLISVDSVLISFIIFCVFHFLIFLITRSTIQLLFHLSYRIFQSEKFTYIFISFLFLPGTIIHEFAHFTAATITNLKVKDFSVIPQVRENEIKLGHVIYEKKDIFRGTFVGIAPLFGAWAIFILLSLYARFFQNTWWIVALVYYFLFCISSTMFSSKQDMIDAVITLPIFFLIIIASLIAKIDIFFFLQAEQIHRYVLYSFNMVNGYLLLALAIHVIVRVGLQLLAIVKKI